MEGELEIAVYKDILCFQLLKVYCFGFSFRVFGLRVYTLAFPSPAAANCKSIWPSYGYKD